MINHMKIQLLPLLILLLAGTACNRNRVVVRGTVEGGAGETISFEMLDVNRTIVTDSMKIRKDGRFSFSTSLEDPELFILKSSSGKVLNLLLYPGDDVSVYTSAGSFSSGYRVEGSEDKESPQMELVRSAYTRAIVRQKRFTIRYLVEHMTSLSSVYALYQKYDEATPVLGQEPDLQYFKVLADSLETVYPNSSLTRSLRADIEEREAALKQMSHMSSLLEKAEVFTGILDVTIPDRDGKQIALSSLKGKVVLVAFWASGNEESIRALLRLRPLYNRYHPKGFEIYAISLDNDKIRWMSAIDFNEFGWINVSELNYPDSHANVLYNVTGLPAVFLVNREGDIVAKNLYGRTLETWLDNLL
jgi:hypothetical protein